MHETGEKGSEHRLARSPQPGGRHGSHGSAVVAQVVGNHLVLGRVAALAVVLAGELESRLGGLRSPADQLDGVETFRGDFGQFLGEPNGGVRNGVQRRHEADPFLLPADGLDDVLVSMADIDHVDPGHAVDVTLAVHIRQVHPPGFPDDQRIGGKDLHLLQIQQQVPDVVTGNKGRRHGYPAFVTGTFPVRSRLSRREGFPHAPPKGLRRRASWMMASGTSYLLTAMFPW